MRRVFLFSSLVVCMFIAPAAVAHAEGDGGNGKGILSGVSGVSGVLEKVESTMTETTDSVEDVVGSAVEGADRTVQDAVSFTKGTVETLVEPATERPVSEIVNHSVDFVEETVDNVAPVVENTAKTVQTATTSVTGIVEELPEMPVVKPALDEVRGVVNEMTETVSESVENVEVEKAVDSFEEVIGDEMPPPPRTDESSSSNEQLDKVIEQPVFDSNKEMQGNDDVSTFDSPEILESTAPVVEEETVFIPNEAYRETAASSVNKVASKVAAPKEEKPVKQEKPAEQEKPAIPFQSSTQWDGFPIAIATGTTTVINPLVSHGGNADAVTGIVDGFEVLESLSGRQWVHSDEQMRIQWVHAPPGQPPQSTPFLQVIK